MKPLLNRPYTRKQRVIVFLAAFAVSCVAGAGIARVAKAATHHAEAQRLCTHTNPDGDCWFGVKTSARKFRHGYFQKTHGFPAKNVWARPRVARRVWVNKIENRISHMAPERKQKVRDHLGLGRSPGCSDYCLAWKTYGDLMANANCVGYAYPTEDAHTCVYPGQASITKEGIQRGGTLVFCGGTVVIGVATTAGSEGLASPAVVGIWGGLGCGWSFWSSFG